LRIVLKRKLVFLARLHTEIRYFKVEVVGCTLLFMRDICVRPTMHDVLGSWCLAMHFDSQKQCLPEIAQIFVGWVIFHSDMLHFLNKITANPSEVILHRCVFTNTLPHAGGHQPTYPMTYIIQHIKLFILLK